MRALLRWRTVRPCLAVALVLSAPAGHGAEPGAEPPELGFPAACTPGTDCWIVNHVDVLADPAAAADFRCGALTYEKHTGTDIAVRDLRAMAAGVDVLAAAAGRIIRVRDGESDNAGTREELAETRKSGRECGNGVLIGHGGGWQTQYCHMQRGSIAVRPGEQVAAGARLGRVGHSGFAEFPHLHIGVTHRGRTIDPFTGLEPGTQCGATGKPMWRAPLAYEPVAIYAAGFADRVPKYEEIQEHAAGIERIAAGPVELTFWAVLFGTVKDDAIRIEIRAPDGRVVSERDIVQERTRARQFYFIGRRLGDGELRPGDYVGIVRLTRRAAAGEPLTRELERKLTVE
jgi:hypothetical protein